MPKKIRNILETEISYNKLNDLLASYCEDTITLAEQLDLADEINIECKRIIAEIPLNSIPYERDGMGLFLQKLVLYTDRNIQEILNTKNKIEIKSMLAERRGKIIIDPEFIPSKKVKTGVLSNVDPSKASNPIIRQFQTLMIKALLVKKNRARIVNQRSRILDRKMATQKLSAKQRAAHRVIIIKGIFCKRKLGLNVKSEAWLKRRRVRSRYAKFSTQNMLSHDKLGYAAYTLNMYGELSVFDHYSGREAKIGPTFHSTMNAGAAVISAGEIKISPYGELEVLTVHSGHYQPGPLQVYNTLKYFKEQGIDISKAKVMFFGNLRDYGIKSKFDALGGNYLNTTYNAQDLYEEIDKILISKNPDKIDRLEAKGIYKPIKKVQDKFSNILDELEQLDRKLDSTEQGKKLAYLKQIVNGLEKQIRIENNKPLKKEKKSILDRIMFTIYGSKQEEFDEVVVKKLIDAKDDVQAIIDMQTEMCQAVKSIKEQAYEYRVSGWLDVESAISKVNQLPKFISEVMVDLENHSLKYVDLPTMEIPKLIAETMGNVRKLDSEIKSTMQYK